MLVALTAATDDDVENVVDEDAISFTLTNGMSSTPHNLARHATVGIIFCCKLNE